MADWTGVGRYTRSLTRALAERGDVSIVQLVAPGEAPPVPDAESIQAEGHPFGLAGMRAYGRAVRRVQPDLVHSLHFPTPTPLPHPLVVTVHDLIPLAVPAVMPSSVRRATYRLLVGRAIRGADSIIVPSRSTAAAVREFSASADEKLTLTPYAADDFGSDAGQLPDAVQSLDRYVLGFASVKPHKRLDVLLDAWQHALPLLDPGVSLVLVGSPTDVYRGHALARAGHPRIVWVDGVDDAQLRALYAGAAVFAFPSVYEGFGLPPLEAMASGAPVVCTDAASVPEVVGDAALVVPSGDASALAGAMLRLLADPALAADLARRGLDRAATFTWARTAELTVAVYRRVLGPSL
ncbi:MAG: glycosyltransferase family 4 protein [Coriobacteriia bacterium]|nr:glycosyltransferase family 4 protein [Coriobacteriia bacterium]